MSEPIEMTLTNNFYTFVRTLLFGDEHKQGTSYSSSDGFYQSSSSSPKKWFCGPLINSEGVDMSIYTFEGSTSTFASRLNFQSFYNNNQNRVSKSDSSPANQFRLGSGHLSPTKDDYTLDQEILFNKFQISLNCQKTLYENQIKIIYQLNITNKDTTELVISEIGWYHDCTFMDGYTSKGVSNFLIGRSLLENSITLQPEESTTLQISISF